MPIKYIVRTILILADSKGILMRCLASKYIPYGTAKIVVDLMPPYDLWISAARSGHIEVLRVLVERKIEVSYKEYYAFRISAANGFYEQTEYLIDCGSDIRAAQNYAMIEACYKGHLKIMKLLSSRGAILDDRVLGKAITYKHKEIIEFIVIEQLFQPDSENLEGIIKLGYINVVSHLLQEKMTTYQDVSTIAIKRGAVAILEYFDIYYDGLFRDLPPYDDARLYAINHRNYKFSIENFDYLIARSSGYRVIRKIMKTSQDPKFLLEHCIMKYTPDIWCVYFDIFKNRHAQLELPDNCEMKDLGKIYETMDYAVGMGVSIELVGIQLDLDIIIKIDASNLLLTKRPICLTEQQMGKIVFQSKHKILRVLIAEKIVIPKRLLRKAISGLSGVKLENTNIMRELLNKAKYL